ncbi:hypothetical protein LH128_16036 [Sphingomonas sp. LH128]|nr:hypothetical protein LH128_16036 [Sphingomonas sp. LH128]
MTRLMHERSLKIAIFPHIFQPLTNRNIIDFPLGHAIPRVVHKAPFRCSPQLFGIILDEAHIIEIVLRHLNFDRDKLPKRTT